MQKCDNNRASGLLATSLCFRQKIEGRNVQHLKKGTSNAESLTLSFYIKSSVTGTYILETFTTLTTLVKSASPILFPSANTWEKKTITFPADTTGAFDNDSNRSLLVHWWLGAGSSYQSGTLNTSWASVTTANRVVGQVNAINSTDNNILQITGVQFEIGEKATPFEHRSFADELHQMQRYYLSVKNQQTYAPVGGVRLGPAQEETVHITFHAKCVQTPQLVWQITMFDIVPLGGNRLLSLMMVLICSLLKWGGNPLALPTVIFINLSLVTIQMANYALIRRCNDG